MQFFGPASKKKINLGGQTTKSEDRNKFLQRTETERLRRLQEKKRQQSATKIQSFWRAKKHLEHQRNLEREDWKGKMQKMALLPPQLSSALPILFPSLRQFLFFYRPFVPEDKKHLLTVCELVQRSAANKGPANFFSLAFEEDPKGLLPNWIHEVKILARTCLDASTIIPDKTVMSALTTLLNPPVAAPVERKNAFVAKILSYLITENYHQYLGRALSNLRYQDVTIPLMELAVMPFFNDSIPSHILQKGGEGFTKYIISLPNIIEQLPSTFRVQKLIPSFQTSLVVYPGLCDAKVKHQAFVIKSAEKEAEEVEITRNTLHNLMVVADAVISQENACASTPYLHIIGRLLSYVIAKFSSSANKTADAVFSDEEDEESDVAPMVSENMAIMDATLEQIQVLLEPSFLKSLFTLYLPTPDNVDKLRIKPFNQVFAPGLVNLCQLCDTLHKNNEAVRTKILNTISFSTTAIISLWHMLTSSIEFETFVEKGVSACQDDMIPIVSLFCVCYSHALVGMDDNEFFDKERYFALKEVASMITLLKRIVFRMYWVKGNRDISEVYQNRALRQAITSVLHQLYDRNSRHDYCPEHHWEVEEIMQNSTQFMFEAAAGDKRAKRILKKVPFVVPAKMRVLIFNKLLDADKERFYEYRGWDGETRITIRRAHVFEDGYKAFSEMRQEQLKGSMKVSFINSEGLPEAGIDGGGVFKEFVTELSKKAFGREFGLFTEAEDRLLYPNPLSSFDPDNLRHFEFLGRVLGKAMYEGILIEVPLAKFFLAKLLRKFNYYNDLIFLDRQLYKSLMELKNFTGNVEETYCLNFVIGSESGETIELVPGGGEKAVTNKNRMEYIYAIANYKLNVQIRDQSRAFLKGFSDVVHPDWLRMFNQHELLWLINGQQGGIDLVDLRENTKYAGGYDDRHPVIEMFWSVVEEMTVEEQRALLKFATSCSRPPLLGFGYLQPPFSIHMAYETERLPTASTCMNLLKLAPYPTKSILREKLLYAISSCSGFELS